MNAFWERTLADQSVRPISSTIDMELLARLATLAGSDSATSPEP